MKTVACKVTTVVNTEIFECGDLIVWFDKPRNKNVYAVVLEDQDPYNVNIVKVRNISDGIDTVWHDFECKFVTHLTNAILCKR